MRRHLFAFALIVSAGCGSPAPQPAPAPSPTPAPAAPAEPLTLRPASPSHPNVERRSAEDVRPGAGAGVRVQPRGRDPIVPARRRARSVRAMPHWGKAWALGPNYNLDIDDARAKAAYEALAKAQSLVRANGPEQVEKRATSMRLRFATRQISKADRAALARAFSQAMGDLSQHVSRRSRCRRHLRRKPDEPDAVETLDARRHARGRTPSRSLRCSSRCCSAIRITSARITTTFTPSRPRARRRARCRARSA